MNLSAGFALILAITPTLNAHASTVNIGEIRTNTFNGQSSSAIIFSSSLYMTGGASLILENSAGYISAASSINASSFFGDGQHLGGISNSLLTSTQTFTGADTFTSSFTVQSGGRQIILSTSAFVNNVLITTTGVVSFYPSLHNSSATTIPQFSTTASTLTTCVSGSTLTITTTGGRVELIFSGILYSDKSQFTISFLQDGQFVNNLDGHEGIAKFGGGFASAPQSISFAYILDAPSSGPHSYCLTIANAPFIGGTTTLVNNNGLDPSPLPGARSGRNIFYVKELK